MSFPSARWSAAKLKTAAAAAAILTMLCGAAFVRSQDAKPDKPDAAGPREVGLTTIHDEKLRAELLSITDGKLLVATEPQRAIPLDELDRIDFNRAKVDIARALGQSNTASRLAQMLGKKTPAKLSAEWLGEDNHDFAQPGQVEGASGIQDLHIQVTGLPRERKLKQVVMQQRDKIWRMDPSGTSDSKLVVATKAGADTAELYAEPASGSQSTSRFTIEITYDDMSTAKLSVIPTKPIKGDLKFVAAKEDSGTPSVAAAPATSDAQTVVVRLEGIGELTGKLEALGQESLRLVTPTVGAVEIPLLASRAVWFPSANSLGKAKEQFNARLLAPGNEDCVLVRGDDQSVTDITGQVVQLQDQKLQFKYEGETRSINIARVVGLVFAAHAKSAPVDRPYQVFELANGNRLAGSWIGFGEGVLEVQPAWDAKLRIPTTSVASIVFRNGKLIYLSDLEPVSVEEVPYFDRATPYQKDKNLLGEPLKVKGKEYRKGLAVHSRSVLTYDLEGKYAQFKALVGFDDGVPARGRVACRVLADGKPIFAEADLRASAEPKPVELDVRGARQLSLEIDFGEDENICDRVIWADARLYRE